MFLLIIALAYADMPSKLPLDDIRGEELYTSFCWQCHGKLALGDGPQSEILNAPPLFKVVEFGSGKKNWEAAIDTIQKGKGKMPAALHSTSSTWTCGQA